MKNFRTLSQVTTFWLNSRLKFPIFLPFSYHLPENKHTLIAKTHPNDKTDT
uniref:Uncharacterized protein n=1 Tax=Rhizophora mucronata TaxID=61149 RepID=A0A2P2R3R1_RHIMU